MGGGAALFIFGGGKEEEEEEEEEGSERKKFLGRRKKGEKKKRLKKKLALTCSSSSSLTATATAVICASVSCCCEAASTSISSPSRARRLAPRVGRPVAVAAAAAGVAAAARVRAEAARALEGLRPPVAGAAARSPVACGSRRAPCSRAPGRSLSSRTPGWSVLLLFHWAREGELPRWSGAGGANRSAKAAAASVEAILEAQLAVREQVLLSEKVTDYLFRIVAATRNHPLILSGLSTRAGINLAEAARANAYLEGRDYVIPEDVKQLAVPVGAHRIIAAAYQDGLNKEQLLRSILKEIPVPLV